MNQEADIDRTSAVGLFNTARSYWRSAEQLNGDPPRVTHPESPITFLLCHAIELYLKAYLRGAGRDLAELKRLGHRVADLSRAAGKFGLDVPQEQEQILSHIDDAEVAIEARYIVTGFKHVPTNDALSEVAAALDGKVCDALKKFGFPVRTEMFALTQTAPKSEMAEDAQRVLVSLFKARSSDECGVRQMAKGLAIDEGMLKYHLDCLDDDKLAECVGFSPSDVLWAITPKGRKYAVLHKLVG